MACKTSTELCNADYLRRFLIFSELFSIKEYKKSLVNESTIEWNEEKSIIFTVS